MHSSGWRFASQCESASIFGKEHIVRQFNTPDTSTRWKQSPRLRNSGSRIHKQENGICLISPPKSDVTHAEEIMDAQSERECPCRSMHIMHPYNQQHRIIGCCWWSFDYPKNCPKITQKLHFYIESITSILKSFIINYPKKGSFSLMDGSWFHPAAGLLFLLFLSFLAMTKGYPRTTGLPTNTCRPKNNVVYTQLQCHQTYHHSEALYHPLLVILGTVPNWLYILVYHIASRKLQNHKTFIDTRANKTDHRL